jgi:predicted nucleotidyltransferase
MTVEPPRRPLTIADVRKHKAELKALAQRHGVADVHIFGSVARNEATHTSDLDLLVTALPGSGLLALSAFAAEVEDMLGIPTQVTTVNGLKPRIRDRVTAEAVPL